MSERSVAKMKCKNCERKNRLLQDLKMFIVAEGLKKLIDLELQEPCDVLITGDKDETSK